MTSFIQLLRYIKNQFGYKIFAFGLSAGICNTVLIALINESIRKSTTENLIRYGLAYALAAALFFLLQYFYLTLLIRISERIILNARLSIVEKIRTSNFERFESIGATKL